MSKEGGSMSSEEILAAMLGGGHKMIQNQNGKIEGSRTKRTRKSETSINDDEGHG